MNCPSKQIELLQLPSREATASFPSRITFQWFWPLAYLGYKKPLEFKDLWDLNPEDKSRAVVDHFNKFWRSETAKTRLGVISCIHVAIWHVDVRTIITCFQSFQVPKRPQTGHRGRLEEVRR